MPGAGAFYFIDEKTAFCPKFSAQNKKTASRPKFISANRLPKGYLLRNCNDSISRPCVLSKVVITTTPLTSRIKEISLYVPGKRGNASSSSAASGSPKRT